jgi:pimeloyl-ACP methyl ester carboxylesterase
MHWREYQRNQRVVELADTFISYVEEGEGEPIVLLHGIPTWGFLYSRLYRAFAKGHRTLVPDLLGFGFSDRRDSFDRSIVRQAELLDSWMERIGASRATVVGHDIGGAVALRLAIRFPERVSRLCLIDSVCYDSWPIGPMHELGLPRNHRRLSAKTMVGLMKLALGRGFAVAPPEGFVEGLLAPYATEVGKLSLIRNAVSLDTNLTMELVSRLPHIGVPTLILWGEEDTFQPALFGERLTLDIPGAQLARIPGAKHFLMVDQPHEVASRLFGFLGEELEPWPLPEQVQEPAVS